MIIEHGWKPQDWLDLERSHKAFIIASYTTHAKEMKKHQANMRQKRSSARRR